MPAENEPAVDHLSGWDELRRAADQLELEIHLGTMEARDHWRALRPKLEELEKRIAAAGSRAGHAIAKEIASLAETIRGLRDGIDHADN
jgi:hypothetical protein